MTERLFGVAIEPPDEKAGFGLRLATTASLAFAALAHTIVLRLTMPFRAVERIGTVALFFGTLVSLLPIPLVALWAASVWEANRTQRRRYLIFMISCLSLVLVPVAIAGVMALRGPAWDFDSGAYTIRFPTREWRPVSRPAHLADFWRMTESTEMFVGVLSVQQEPLEAFRAGSTNFKDYFFAKAAPGQTRATAEATSDDDHHEYLALRRARGDAHLVAMCRTWLGSKRATVTMLLEGRKRWRDSAIEKADADLDSFAAAAKGMCLTVH